MSLQQDLLHRRYHLRLPPPQSNGDKTEPRLGSTTPSVDDKGDLNPNDDDDDLDDSAGVAFSISFTAASAS